MRSLELARKAGVKLGFGTDLLGQLQDDQCKEFLIRAQAMKPFEIIQLGDDHQCRDPAEAGRAWRTVPGAYADLLVIDGNPYPDLNLFQDEGKHLSAIMKGGRFYKNRLN